MDEPEKAPRLTPLTNPNAVWRKMPASAKQMRFLARLGIAHVPETTAGEAADLLCQAITEQERQQARQSD